MTAADKPLITREAGIMFEWLMRWWRVEIALFLCYFDSWQRGDNVSFRYCAHKSKLVSGFWIAIYFMGQFIVGCLLR